MKVFTRRSRFLLFSVLRHDLKASITVFFVALPLCLGIALATGAPLYSGIISGILGGLLIAPLSKSQLSVSGPAAGLTAICAAAIHELGTFELFSLSVAMAGILQLLLGLFRLGGFTHFIPSSVIKGMLAAIGIILVSKQIPLLIGYDKPDFWTNQLFNIFTLSHDFRLTETIFGPSAWGAIVVAGATLLAVVSWNRFLAAKARFIPVSFLIVVAGSVCAYLLHLFAPAIQLAPSQYVQIPHNLYGQVHLPDFTAMLSHAAIWRNAVIICFVASLETLLSIEAIDKLDPQNRITPQNRELMAQGTGNCFSGLLGGLPLTAVIVRSAANAEAGAKTKTSAILHSTWLLLAVVFAGPVLNHIPFCVLALILIRTGYNLAKPAMVRAVYKQGREQFMPFIVTLFAILFTDLLIGVIIGCIYAIYYLIKHTYRAGYTLKEFTEGHISHFDIVLALNVSFLNKRRFMELLDRIPSYSVVNINGTNSVYIDRDILEIFHDFKSKAHHKHIQLTMQHIPDVETIELH